ncbi:MAG: prephenate dehydratase [Peltula sp. TS41687]|nr:MAG: prephenate dehydratase [Peltula sp. TS41687]
MSSINTKTAVAYLGPPSTYSHQAALEYFEQERYTLKPHRTIQDIFEAVQSSHVTYGVVPFENSTNGSVVFTLGLFADRQHHYPNIFVCGETYLAVHHYLLGHNKPSQSQQTSLNHIQRVYSHPQAFGQCERFLSTQLPHAERYEVSSTSKAAEIVAKNHPSQPDSAAIASRAAVHVHALDVLASNIEDREDNTTRFLILKNRTPSDEDHLSPDHHHREARASEEEKTLISFTIDHFSPGALAEALLVFKEHRLNLTSINSRPSGEVPWHYVFFIEFRGASGSDRDGEDGSVKKALHDLSKVTTACRWLGSWKNQLLKE